jgi:hypothetical protein
MNEDNSSCLLTNRQKQHEFLLTYVAKHGVETSYSFSNNCLCGCGGMLCIHSTFVYNPSVINKDILYVILAWIWIWGASSYWLVLSSWMLAEQTKDDRFCLVGFDKRHEVIKLTDGTDSPLCTILSSGGTFNNVIDLGWFRNIEGNNKK